MSNLAKQITLNNGAVLKNSVVMAPMTTWASNDDYTVSEGELAYYRYRNNGAGMMITGCTHIQENGIGFTNEFAAYDDKFIPGLKKLASTFKENGAKAILQINHAGNKALPDLFEGDVVSSSSVETKATDFAPALKPKELTEEEITQIIRDFGETTRRAIEAGFDGIEIHGAHGFLLQNFVSPFFNKRQDQWGGSLENRLRFPMAVVTEIKRVIEAYASKDFILGYRISPDEPMAGALRMTDTYALTDKLIDMGVTYIHASLPDALQAKPVDATDDVTYLEALSQHINQRVLFVAAGMIQTPQQAEKILEKGALPAIGHGFVTEPLWMEKAEAGQADDIRLTIKKNDVVDLRLPEKMWVAIQNSGDWFTIE
ncbi:NADH-dependent flavin oxidoreductase [Enterococcus sp. AZ109]|uniref:NADH-dependent flavin oxidoreductase n=1 Tax=Enterococcus sp. AZ109 TaxID=2774634 RepID=UPI003F29A02E